MDVFSIDDLIKEASAHIDDGEYEEAVEPLELAYQWSFNASDKTRLLTLMSTCYRVIDQPHKAIELYESAKNEGLSLRPDFLTSTGAAYYDTGDKENASRFADHAAARYKAYGIQFPEDLQVLFRRLEK